MFILGIGTYLKYIENEQNYRKYDIYKQVFMFTFNFVILIKHQLEHGR